MEDPYDRPRAVPRALVAVAIGWGATLVHLVTFVIVLFAVVRAQPGDDGTGAAVVAVGNMLVLAAALVMLPIGAFRVRKGLGDGRVMVSAAGVAPMPGFLCCTSFVGFAGLTYQNVEDPDALRDSLAVVSGLCSGLACVALIAAIVYLWQPAVTRWFRANLTLVSGPRPSAPGQW
ncbi:hypothetical protein [Phytomonospora endophytica]|uniref:Uncharacterized protein n=1 Tax=Phytomonospora endophytica TaxID=714109 RepID=A0A841G2X1_9ACTN|nr:hypothetical protein [Phytomonospora endophytica]MBB6039059.1 hypothetical protein [Phytomonospora endophytica]GIG71488.1 hypothetical protein Pen01_77830 [Phytomonospora endophytica]